MCEKAPRHESLLENTPTSTPPVLSARVASRANHSSGITGQSMHSSIPRLLSSHGTLRLSSVRSTHRAPGMRCWHSSRARELMSAQIIDQPRSARICEKRPASQPISSATVGGAANSLAWRMSSRSSRLVYATNRLSPAVRSQFGNSIGSPCVLFLP